MKQWRIAMTVAVLLLIVFLTQFGISFPKHDQTSSQRREVDAKQKVKSLEVPFPKTATVERKHKLTLFRSKKNYTVQQVNKSENFKSKCWEKEEFVALAECKRCHQFEKRKLSECQLTGNIQRVRCKISGLEVHKSCPHVRWFEERKFWIFEAGILIVLVCSGFMVWHRSRELEVKFYEKLKKQVADKV